MADLHHLTGHHQYFGADWPGPAHLEDLYGPLGAHEFLAEPAPQDEQRRAEERAYFRWLGVADRPRLLAFDNAVQEASIRSGSVWSRPHGVSRDKWMAYLRSIADQVRDSQGHPLSQQLRTWTLDRLDDILLAPTARQGQALLHLLCENWAEYELALSGEVR